MTEFTPLAALIGGGLIGLASAALMASLGRIAGISGVIGGLLPPAPVADWAWRLAFLAGMIAAPPAYALATGDWPEIEVPLGLPMLLLGGFLVGIGVSYGSGCTSGHGVCGVARLSPRSIAATLTFMISTGATVYVLRHLIGL